MINTVSLEKQDFETVYGELSEQIGFDDTQADVRPFLPEVNPMVGADVTELVNPLRPTWTEDGIVDIARVSGLGRFFVEDTKRRLLVKYGEKDLPDPYHFQASAWYAKNPKQERKTDLGPITPESIFPEHIAEFPDKGYVNCLGAAIGMTALAELRGWDYVFASELRNDSEDLQRNFFGLERHIKKLFPEAYEPGSLPFESIVVNDLVFKEEHARLYKGMPLKNQGHVSALKQTRLRDYHHYLLVGNDEWSSKRTAQLDPYSLTLRFSETFSRDDLVDVATSITPDRSFILEDRELADTYRGLSALLDVVAGIRAGDFVGMSQELKAEAKRLMPFLAKEVSAPDGSKTREIGDIYWSSAVSNAVSATLLVRAKALGMDAEYNQLVQILEDNDTSDAYDQIGNRILDETQRRAKYDKHIQDLIEHIQQNYAAAVFVNIYRFVLQYQINLRETGMINRSAELGDTDFTIGSMTLNHYANSKKDGRINVARYLARYSGSQLTWLAAVCEVEGEEDPSLEVMRERVKKLSTSQMHPRVQLVVR